MRNQELARRFERIADALELKGETGFRVLAYRKAARALADLAQDVADLAEPGLLEEIPGIGKGIAAKVREFLATGRLKKYDEALAGLPQGLFAMLDIPGIGPATARLLHERLKVAGLTDLRRALDSGAVAALPGMGERKVEHIRRGLAAAEQSGERMWLNAALELAEQVIESLRALPAVRRAEPAGSLRRGRESVGDIDLLVSASDPGIVVRRFTALDRVREIIKTGDAGASVRLETPDGLRQVDMRIVPEESFGAALQYFTGSKEHNVALRARARRLGLKLSEWGLFKGRKLVAGRTEEAVYAALNLPCIEPELRENRGELAAAESGTLPRLVTGRDIRADLHLHTDASDGSASFTQMVEAGARRGYTHLAIADHSVSANYAGGLTADALRRHIDRVDAFNARARTVKVLKASEVDIRPDGRLDYPDSLLARLDLVIASIHQSFQHEATKRMCDAIGHPLVHIIGHPSGRIINQRPGYDIDLEQVIACAARHGKVLEINAYPGRLDLPDVWARKARDNGVRIAVNTDAHAVPDLGWMRYGVTTARRAWLEREDVINCMTYKQLVAFLEEIRNRGGA